MHLYEDQFSSVHDFPGFSGPAKVLVIASTERCGSHMLGHALHSTKKFGFPLEYANPVNVARWQKQLEIEHFSQLIEELKRRRTSPNGVFSIKLHYAHLEQFGGFKAFCDVFPDAYYVILTRKDVLRQAVSLSIANQTGVWIAGQEPIEENPQYSFDEIDGFLRHLVSTSSSWKYSLASSGCKTVEMFFEDVRAEPAIAISKIARFMNINICEDDLPAKQVTIRQSDERNAEWADRFIRDFDRSRELFPRGPEGSIAGFPVRLLKRIANRVGI